MNPQELMIGDIVKFTDIDSKTRICKVEGVTCDCDFFLKDIDGTPVNVFNEADAKYIEPIEIDEEFLLNNGFKPTEDRPYVYVYLDDPDMKGIFTSTVLVHFFTIGTLIKAQRHYPTYPKSVHFPDSPYIHQLQQACRLCGIEIDWKP